MCATVDISTVDIHEELARLRALEIHFGFSEKLVGHSMSEGLVEGDIGPQHGYV